MSATEGAVEDVLLQWEQSIGLKRNSYDNARSGKTTLMLKNLLASQTQRDLLDLFATRQFVPGRSFDFFYLPMDFRSRSNYGYCFINFVTVSESRRFYATFNQASLPVSAPRKVCEVTYARVQGRKNNIEQFRNSPINSIPAEISHYRPIIFDTRGNILPFPEPDQPLPALQLRDARKKTFAPGGVDPLDGANGCSQHLENPFVQQHFGAMSCEAGGSHDATSCASAAGAMHHQHQSPSTLLPPCSGLDHFHFMDQQALTHSMATVSTLAASPDTIAASPATTDGSANSGLLPPTTLSGANTSFLNHASGATSGAVQQNSNSTACNSTQSEGAGMSNPGIPTNNGARKVFGTTPIDVEKIKSTSAPKNTSDGNTSKGAPSTLPDETHATGGGAMKYNTTTRMSRSLNVNGVAHPHQLSPQVSTSGASAKSYSNSARGGNVRQQHMSCKYDTSASRPEAAACSAAACAATNYNNYNAAPGLSPADASRAGGGAAALYNYYLQNPSVAAAAAGALAVGVNPSILFSPVPGTAAAGQTTASSNSWQYHDLRDAHYFTNATSAWDASGSYLAGTPGATYYPHTGYADAPFW
ncbi:unnamed protein product [Amoebophrya sp. A25]|nr:unnamed protein product [Amoebophrya sp. A25]|eukprot:GSA25T00007727001.1